MDEASAPASNRSAGRRRKAIGAALIAIWAAGMLLAISTIALPHMAPMPGASRAARTTQALLALRRDPRREFIVHVIAAHCSCTDRLFAHLVQRGPFADADEVVVFAGEDAAKQAAATRAGFRYATVTADDLAARYLLESAPVMFAFDAHGSLRYAGGYFNNPSDVTPLDEDLHAQVGRGATPTPLPVYGCAVSTRLRDSIDPLGISSGIERARERL